MRSTQVSGLEFEPGAPLLLRMSAAVTSSTPGGQRG
jgi:hypothetical protein